MHLRGLCLGFVGCHKLGGVLLLTCGWQKPSSQTWYQVRAFVWGDLSLLSMTRGIDEGELMTKQSLACSNAAFIFMGTMLRALSLAASVHSGVPSQENGGVAVPPSTTIEPSYPLLEPVRGIIFDSCPCRLDPDIAARYAHVITGFLLTFGTCSCTCKHVCARLRWCVFFGVGVRPS